MHVRVKKNNDRGKDNVRVKNATRLVCINCTMYLILHVVVPTSINNKLRNALSNLYNLFFLSFTIFSTKEILNLWTGIGTVHFH